MSHCAKTVKNAQWVKLTWKQQFYFFNLFNFFSKCPTVRLHFLPQFGFALLFFKVLYCILLSLLFLLATFLVALLPSELKEINYRACVCVPHTYALQLLIRINLLAHMLEFCLQLFSILLLAHNYKHSHAHIQTQKHKYVCSVIF